MSNLNKLTRILLFFAAGIAVSVALGWWLMQMLREKEETEEALIVAPDRPLDVQIPLPPQPDDLEVEAIEVPADASAPVVDDLTRIEGIGPKYSQGLHALGIDTFSALAQQDAAELAEKLRGQGLRVIGDSINDKAWIAQAQELAAQKG